MESTYPNAVWMPASPTNYRRAGRLSYAQVVIHATDGHGDPLATAAMWATPRHGSSAHLVVGQDGTIVQSVSLADIAWHAHAANSLSVGVEHCCRTPGELGPDDAGLPPSLVQLAASARLIAWLCRNAGLPITRDVVRGHHEIDPASTHYDCPTGAGVDLDVLVTTAAALVLAPFA